ncbi:MAG: hypothetical protein HZA79_07145 [Sphingobacteriales bacterium]|nr:hypothetical protein [Sphingobacteriales bacterium]
MEQQENSLFGLSLDATSTSHLKETASWARLLAIVGMVMCVLMVLGGILASVAVSKATGELEREFRSGGYGSGAAAGMGAAVAVVYIIVALIYFFPCLFTLRFANYIKTAINANDQQALNEGLRNLKATFRYMGIITIIFIAFFVLALLLGGMGAIMSA